MRRCFESSTFELVAASVSTRSVGSVDLGVFLGNSVVHTARIVRVSLFILSIRALLYTHSVHSLKGSVTGCVNGLPNERRFFEGFGRKSIFLIRVLVARGISRARWVRGVCRSTTLM